MSSSRRSSSTPITSAIASRVTSSGVGPSPPHTMTASARSRSSRRHCDHAVEVVADLAVLAGVDAGGRELLADPRAVGVDDLAEQQLGADREDVTPHPAAFASGLAARLALAADHDVEARTPPTARPRTTAGCRGTSPTRTWAAAARRRRRGTGRTPSTCRACAPAARCRAGPRTTGTSETPTSRTVTMSTAAHEKSPLMPSAKNPPSTRNLSASGSRNAPERVVPSRRASQPSRPSVVVSTNHSDTVSHARALVDDEQQRGDREDEPGDGDEVRGGGDGVVAVATRTRGGGRRRTACSRGRRLGDEVGAERLGDVRAARAHPGAPSRRARRTTPSISGASRCVRPSSTPPSVVARRRRAPRPPRPTSASRAARVIGSCTASHSRSHSTRELRVDRVGQRRRGRAVLGREREEPGPVERRGVEEREQLVVLALVLAGEADDERRPERGVGLLARGWRRSSARKRSPLPHRFMRRSSAASACCSERSK